MIKNPVLRNSTLGTLGTLATELLLTGRDSNPPKVGVGQPLTGDIALLGQNLHNGVKLAVAELNKAGFKIKGKPVTLEIVATDDRADPKTGKDVVQKLVDAGVVAVIANLNSDVSIAAAPIYAAHNIAQLAISTNSKFTQLDLPTTCRLVANETLQAKAMDSFAASPLNATRFAVAVDGTPYGEGLANDALEQLKNCQKINLAAPVTGQQDRPFRRFCRQTQAS